MPASPPHLTGLPTSNARAALIGLAVLVAVAGCTSKVSQRSPDGAAVVTRVVDGDTIQVRIAGHLERVRLLGIDTPESVKPSTPPECFSHEASQATKDYLPAGTKVDLVRDVEARDQYGRLLAYVYRQHDHSFVNLWLVEHGFAGLLTYRPNVAHASELSQAVSQARTGGVGVWSTCGDIHVRR